MVSVTTNKQNTTTSSVTPHTTTHDWTETAQAALRGHRERRDLEVLDYLQKEASPALQPGVIVGPQPWTEIPRAPVEGGVVEEIGRASCRERV